MAASDEQHTPMIPIPDPTAVTTDNIRREIKQLQELLESKMDVMATRLSGLGDVLEERLRRSEELLEERDQRYTERFTSQQKAVDAAFAAAEKAGNAALESKDTATSAAFAASEKAILKAEVSIEKRADATYVALSELTRMLGNLMPRPEAEGRLRDSATKIDKLERELASSVRREEYDVRHKALNDLVIATNTRVERMEAYGGGAKVENRLDGIVSQLDANSRSIVNRDGMTTGSQSTRTAIYAALGALGVLIGIFSFVSADRASPEPVIVQVVTPTTAG